MSPSSESFIDCPACGRSQRAGLAECAHCGVIFARYRPRKAQEQPSPAGQGAQDLPYRPVPLGLSRRERLLFMLSQTVEAGVSLRDFAHGPALRTFPARFVDALKKVSQAEVPISDALKSVGVLDGAGHALIRASEAANASSAALLVLSKRAAQQRRDRLVLSLLLVYPALLTLSALVIVPLPSIFQLGIGGYLLRVLGRIAILVVAGLVVVLGFPRLDPESLPRRTLRRAAQLSPLIGSMLWHRALASFAGSLAMCLERGLPLRASFSLAARAGQHPRLAASADGVLGALDAGSSLADALERQTPLPRDFVALVGHGHQVGKLPEVLASLAAEHERRARVSFLLLLVVAGLMTVLGILVYLTYSVATGWARTFGALGEQLEQLQKLDILFQ